MADGADSYIEGDPFDPEQIDLAEIERQEATGETNDKTAAYLRARQAAYKALFAGTAEEWQRELVMMDLAHFCRAYKPTFHPTNQKIQDALEGRREVYQRIMDHTCLSNEALFIKYTGTYNT